jgi:hypothetical protein
MLVVVFTKNITLIKAYRNPPKEDAQMVFRFHQGLSQKTLLASLGGWRLHCKQTAGGCAKI